MTLNLGAALTILSVGGQSGSLRPEFNGILLLPAGEALIRLLELYPDLASRFNDPSASSDLAPDMGQ